MIQPHEAHHSCSFSTSWDNFDENQIESSVNSSQYHMSGPSTGTSDTVTQVNALHSRQSPSQSLEIQDLASKKSTKKKALAAIDNYDPFWMQKTEVDPRFASATGTKMKFEKLFSDGVIQVGDCLVIPVNYHVDKTAHEESSLHEDNSVHEDVAILTVRLANPSISSTDTNHSCSFPSSSPTTPP